MTAVELVAELAAVELHEKHVVGLVGTLFVYLFEALRERIRAIVVYLSLDLCLGNTTSIV